MDKIQETIKKIVEIEWEMFTSVNEGEPHASCQDDRLTFEGMRAAQFREWSLHAAVEYLDDLQTARAAGRNLAEEKYIHMMKTTEPSRYSALLSRVVMPTDSARALAQEINAILIGQTRLLYESYPYVSGQGRPLYSAFDYNGISVETYQFGELLTYSEKTLSALKEHVLALEKSNISLARRILESTVRFYGYDSLDSAESATKERIDSEGIQISYGCGGVCDI